MDLLPVANAMHSVGQATAEDVERERKIAAAFDDWMGMEGLIAYDVVIARQDRLFEILNGRSAEMKAVSVAIDTLSRMLDPIAQRDYQLLLAQTKGSAVAQAMMEAAKPKRAIRECLDA